MTDTTRTLAERACYLIGVAARAPSLHNTQPWRFTVSGDAIELYADTSRQLAVDPDGREMIISCGAALFGLRLAVRSLGFLAEVDLFPGPASRLPGSAGRWPVARVRLGLAAPMRADERTILAALPHRHTRRGPFEDGPLPAGLLGQLQDEALAEGAILSEIEPGPGREEPSGREVLSGRAAGPGHEAELMSETGRLPQRDFDLACDLGLLPADGPAPPVTAVLFTAADGERDWLRAGQALQRLLLCAASHWVFASLNTQPLEDTATRALIRDRLALPGAPQLLLALGVSRTSHPTARRPSAVRDRLTYLPASTEDHHAS